MHRTKFTINESSTQNYPSSKELTERLRFRRHGRNLQSIESKKEEQNKSTNFPLSSNQLPKTETSPSSTEKYKKFKGRFTKKNLSKNELNKKNNEEEEKQSLKIIKKNEIINSEIKDTVKCYICFDTINNPKMCPNCHRMACEKCLYNWFQIEHKKNCGFCREKVNFNDMISVPFMSTVVNFLEKVFDEENNKNIIEQFKECCPNHPEEKLYYYCLDCKKGYCKTCFVFFGNEKYKHLKHNIIEYEQYKNLNFSSFKLNEEKINKKIKGFEDYIKRCESYKKAYEFERILGNKVILSLQKEFNRLIDDNIRIINDQILKIKSYIEYYENDKKEITEIYWKFVKNCKNDFNECQKMAQNLVYKIENDISKKLISGKDIEKFNEMTQNIQMRTYQTKLGEFNHENFFLSKSLKLGNSPYDIIIDNRLRNEVLITLMIPKEKITFGHNFTSFIFIRKKGGETETYELEESKEDLENFYYKKRIPWNYFGESVFKIKAVLYDFYFH